MTTANSVIIVSVIVILLSALLYTRYKKIESFTEPTAGALNSSYISTLYQRDGIAACDIIANNTATSSNYIDTLRIRQWKPKEPLSSDGEYCYFFMDDNKRILATDTTDGYVPIKDPLATVTTCEKSQPLFKDTTFITDAFESTAYDRTHNLPYKKCVIKIDPAVVDPASKTQFWDQFGNNNEVFCKGIENTLQDEANAYLKRIDELVTRLNPFRSQYISTASLSNQLDVCTTTNKQLNMSIAASNINLNNLRQQITSSNASFSDSISGLRQRVDTVTKESDSRSANLLSLENQFNQVLSPNIQTATQQLQVLVANRNKCTTQLDDIKARYKTLQSEYANLKNAYTNLNTDFVDCERTQRDLKTRIEQEHPQLLDYLQKLQTLRDQLAKCTADTTNLTQQEKFWKDTLKRTQDDFNKCNESRGTIESSIASLKQKKDALVKEIEEIKRRCRDDQSNFNMAAVNIHREAAKEIISSEQQRCGASIAMRQRRVELLNELNGILNQSNNCDRVITACKCYQFAGQFGWNDHGSGGSQLNTTVGRIVEIRRYVDAGAIYVKFVHSDGQQTRMYRVTNTRKKRGGGSFINIEAALQRASGAPINVLRMYKQV